ncbi:MAG: hypothetical protein KDI01_00255 [Halioglobus sp.]|nr:hypothetical protein [Halioglobus sp.]
MNIAGYSIRHRTVSAMVLVLTLVVVPVLYLVFHRVGLHRHQKATAERLICKYDH